VPFAAALVVTIAGRAAAAVTEAPAALDFGIVFGGWGIYADGDGEPSIPDQSLEAWSIPGGFDEHWTTEESGAVAGASLRGTSAVTASTAALVVEIGLSAMVLAAVSPDASSPDAVAIAEAFFDELYLGFEIFTESSITVESLETDGGWAIVSEQAVTPGFSDLSLDGAFLSVTAHPGEWLEDRVDFAWRITITGVPGPSSVLLLMFGGLGLGRRRRGMA